MSRFETLLNALLNGEQVDFKPQSRMEQYLINCINGSGGEGLPAPKSRAEVLLYTLAEQLKGGSGGGDSSGSGESWADKVGGQLRTFETLMNNDYIRFDGYGTVSSGGNTSSLTDHIIIPSTIRVWDSDRAVEYIDNAAFENSQITGVTIPASVINIGAGAFGYCGVLSTIIYNGTVEQWNNIPKNSGWNYHVPAAEVICTDGTVAL